jgi:hypothetical protein
MDLPDRLFTWWWKQSQLPKRCVVFKPRQTKKSRTWWSMIALMEAVSTSDASVCFYQTTRRNIPEDSHLCTRRRENLKPHTKFSQWNLCLMPETLFDLLGIIWSSRPSPRSAISVLSSTAQNWMNWMFVFHCFVAPSQVPCPFTVSPFFWSGIRRVTLCWNVNPLRPMTA